MKCFKCGKKAEFTTREGDLLFCEEHARKALIAGKAAFLPRVRGFGKN